MFYHVNRDETLAMSFDLGCQLFEKQKKAVVLSLLYGDLNSISQLGVIQPLAIRYSKGTAGESHISSHPQQNTRGQQAGTIRGEVYTGRQQDGKQPCLETDWEIVI